MIATRALALLLLLAGLVGGTVARAQPAPPAGGAVAEQGVYTAALANRESAKRAQAIEAFIAAYPNSPLRVEAHEQALAAWLAASNPAKADAIATNLLQIDPDNLRGLAGRAYIGRNRLAAGEMAGLAPATAAAEHGLVVLAKWPKPAGLSDADFAKMKQQTAAVFNGMLGLAALSAKDYVKARGYLAEAVTVEPENLMDVYPLAVALLEGIPTDVAGFWYAGRAIVIARAAKNEAAASIEKYARARFQRYHGSEEGWDDILAKAATGRLVPAGFGGSISRTASPADKAVQAASESDPNMLSFSDWELVLSQRDASEANRAAAAKVWKAILEKQRGARLKIPVKVVAVSPARISGAITDQNQASNMVDLEATLSRPLKPLPAVGATISLIGTMSDYRPTPFLFRMVEAELAPESLPVAGGPCADPRPKLCTRDYRPACGLKVDGTRRTYGNACSACADPDVLNQSAGACP